MAKLVVPAPVASTLAQWVFAQTFHYPLSTGETVFEVATNDFRYEAINKLIEKYKRGEKNG